MGRRYFIVMREKSHHDHYSPGHHEHESHAHKRHGHGLRGRDLPYESEAYDLMNDKGFLAYVDRHGYHFTEALAEHVSKMMENADGSKHTWSAEQVKKAMVSLGYFQLTDKNTTKTQATYGDLTYLANMHYADGFPDPLKDEASCLKYAWKNANDPDGYDGMIFSRWTADAIGKDIEIDWDKFV